MQLQFRLWSPKYKFTTSFKMASLRPSCLIVKSQPLNPSKAFLTSWLFTVQVRTLNTCLLCMYRAELLSVLSASPYISATTISATSTTDTIETEDYIIQLPSTDTSIDEPHRECTPESLCPSGDKAFQDPSIGDGNIIDIQYLIYWYFLGWEEVRLWSC